MKKLISFISLTSLALLAAVGMTACVIHDRDDHGDGGVQADKGITVTGDSGTNPDGIFVPTTVVTVKDDACNINSTTRWTPAIYVVEDCDIRVRGALQIDPGVIVKFGTDRSMTVESTGTVKAEGTAVAPIIFTSLRDDAHAGDTNGDLAITSPAAADWEGITLRASGSRFDHCAFFYAGGSDTSALDVGTFAVSVKNSIFAHNKMPNEAMQPEKAALDAAEAAAGTVITGNTFFDNTVPLAISVKFSIDDSNTFDNAVAAPTNPQPSTYNAVFVGGCGHVVSAIEWKVTKVPFVIGAPVGACNWVTIDTAGKLTLANNTAIKFFPGGSLEVQGQLSAIATAANGIVFTSVKDDTAKGDTNGDGSTSTPDSGDWDGIWQRSSGAKFENCLFTYGGGSGSDASVISTSANPIVTVKNCVFAHNKTPTDAITAAPTLDASEAAAGTVITGNTFYDNMVPLAINTTFSIDDSNTFVNGAVKNKYNGIMVTGCGHVVSAIEWKVTKVPLVIGAPVGACNWVTIDTAGKLTLANNTAIKFFPGGSLEVQGQLSAIATAANGIVFTSVKDDTAKGDTNSDGSTSQPASGDWDGIWQRSSGAKFENCLFTYGGGSGSDASVISTSANPIVTVKNCVFAHNKTPTDAITAAPTLDASEAAAGTVITGNTFYDNMVPLAINTTFSMDDSNTFVNGAVKNKYEAVIVPGCGHVAGTVNWSISKVALLVGGPVGACNWMQVDGGGHLTLGANVTMKFFLDGGLFVANGGTLTTVSTNYFTSYKDDSRGGDSNGDGASTGAAGDWSGIKVSNVCQTWPTIHFSTANCP